MGLISCAKKYPVSTFHPKNPALQDSILVFNVFNQDCELVSQLPIHLYTTVLTAKTTSNSKFFQKLYHTSREIA